jgi:long-chain acyl-CoA synthetase
MSAADSDRSKARPYPETLGDFLTDAARRHGGKPALVIKPGVRDRVTTYQSLERDATRVAHLLQERKIAKGDRVLIWAPNMPEWVTIYFGCHKAGVTVVPLDVRSTPDFVASVIRQTDPKLAFLARTTRRLADEIPALAGDEALPLSQPHTGGEEVACLQLEELETALPQEAGLAVTVQADDLAQIMFTSGTTGDPKGVMLTHRNILSNVWGADEVLAVDDRYRFLSLLPLSHMFEQNTGLLAPLAGGAQIVYPVSLQPSILFRTVTEHRITTLVLVPQALQLLLSGIEREAERSGKRGQLDRAFALAERLPRPLRRLLFHSVHAKLGGALSLMISGGAALDPALARKWELMGVTVLQGYGATEAAPIISGDRPGQRKLGAVGRAYPGVEIRTAPDGEVLARGENVFPGYWRNPEATAAALEDGWYHTGDLGEIDAAGYLHLKGRKKDMIVLANGQNVYAEDVERALNQQPAVQEAVVVGHERTAGTVEVHAVLIMRELPRVGESTSNGLARVAGDTVAAANQALAEHQRIQGWTIWPHDDFPRTHTLKVKKHDVLQALVAIQAGQAVAPAPEAPRAETADPLTRIIAEASGVPTSEIRPHCALGEDLNLDSLGRVEVLSAIEEELGAYVDEAAISATTTVADLARMIAAAPRTRAGGGYPSWPRRPLVGLLRELVLQLLLFPGYQLLYDIRIVGRSKVARLQEPALIASNHNFGVGTVGLEPPACWLALPWRRRLRTTTAGEERAVFGPVIKGKLAYFFNSFPLSKEGNVRGTMEQIGRLLDDGWSVLIFPEGKLTVGGPIQPFMGGTGLIAVEARTPVIPMRIVVERPSILEGLRWPPRGKLRIVFGDPLTFAPETSYAAATERIEAAVRGLASE